jgi:hypothetical protein
MRSSAGGRAALDGAVSVAVSLGGGLGLPLFQNIKLLSFVDA